jgi:hypothetical protein
MAYPSKKVTSEQRKQVEAMAAYGVPSEEIGRVMGMTAKTLRKHFREELDTAMTTANAAVAGFLFQNAKNGNVAAQIFWLKTRARWKEPAQAVEHSGAVGSYDLSKVSDADLDRLRGILAPAVAAIAGPDRSGD